MSVSVPENNSFLSFHGGYLLHLDIKNVTNLPISFYSLLCLGPISCFGNCGNVASSRADKGKWSFKFLNSSFWSCFVLGLLTRCPAFLPGLESIWTMLNVISYLLTSAAASSLRPGSHRACVHTPRSQKTQSKRVGLTKICLSAL